MINSISLKNFKKFDKIDVKINPSGLTLISGVNNSGKTSLLHALAVWEHSKMLLTNYKGKDYLCSESSVSESDSTPTVDDLVGDSSAVVFEENTMTISEASADSVKKERKKPKGLGVTPESFSPISMPALKYLWKDQNTNGSYLLRIKIGWNLGGSDDDTCPVENQSKELEIAYTLTGNNFAIKKTESNINAKDTMPTIAYLPPFGGMDEKESLLSVADRKKLIGKGQAGSVIRNLLLEMYREHEGIILAERSALISKGNLSALDGVGKENSNGDKKRLSASDKEVLLSKETTWRQLNKILCEVFLVNLDVRPFDSQFHNFIKIDVLDMVKKGEVGNNGDVSKGTAVAKSDELVPDKSSRRDLMVEGSGFLQWLSVFALALDKNIHTLLLDEPDAHLHSSLQNLLIEKLNKISSGNGKQILMVSHSTELIRNLDCKMILHVENSKANYLEKEDQKILVLEGLGSKYFPLLDAISKHKNVLLVENDSDVRALKALCKALGKTWPSNLVEWITNKKHKERKILIIELNQKIFSSTKDHICAYSLRDLDDENYNTTSENLFDNGKGVQMDDSGENVIMMYRTLRRREIENYLLIPSAISRYISINDKNCSIMKDVGAVNKYLADEHGLVVPGGYRESDRKDNTVALFGNDVKPVFNRIGSHFKVRFEKDKYIEQINACEVPDDIIRVIDEIILMCKR